MVVELRPGGPVRALALAIRIDEAGAVVSLSDPEREFGSLELDRDERQNLQSLVLAVLTGRAVMELYTFLGFAWTRLVRWDGEEWIFPVSIGAALLPARTRVLEYPPYS